MVRRLRAALATSKRGPGPSHDVLADGDQDQMIRDLDDEELDGDIFLSENSDDEGNDNPAAKESVESEDNDEDEDGIPKEALVLPLYSLLSSEDQGKVFAAVPEGQRLIIIATNVAETSITIPGISYVVDSGRHKCRNFKSETGVASYDIMWISKAAADQRAGRAGRTGPGHCYRLYSSSMYSRHMDAFALPEVLTRPLEDVVLSMKAMKLSNISDFPFPTPPDRTQLTAALAILAHIGCIDLTKSETQGNDGEVTRLGAAVAKLPLGVRYGKMLLVGAQGGVLDYAGKFGFLTSRTTFRELTHSFAFQKQQWPWLLPCQRQLHLFPWERRL
jgi:ATP-dependent RNA helicase DHX37/DHR1